MDYQLLKLDNSKNSSWLGGTTKELYINPENGDYDKRVFAYRVSLATSDLDWAIFTLLPGYKRWLMLLEGELVLNHRYDGKNDEIHLSPFQAHWFDGSWETNSQGYCQDFNLIYDENLVAMMRPLICELEDLIYKDEAQEAFLFAYQPLAVRLQYLENFDVEYEYCVADLEVHASEFEKVASLQLEAFELLRLPKGRAVQIDLKGINDQSIKAVYCYLMGEDL